MQQTNKCKSWCCSNYQHEGQFIGEFCLPCYQKITTGIGSHGTAWFYQLGDRIDDLQSKLKTIKDVIDD